MIIKEALMKASAAHRMRHLDVTKAREALAPSAGKGRSCRVPILVCLRAMTALKRNHWGRWYASPLVGARP